MPTTANRLLEDVRPDDSVVAERTPDVALLDVRARARGDVGLTAGVGHDRKAAIAGICASPVPVVMDLRPRRPGAASGIRAVVIRAAGEQVSPVRLRAVRGTVPVDRNSCVDARLAMPGDAFTAAERLRWGKSTGIAGASSADVLGRHGRPVRHRCVPRSREGPDAAVTQAAFAS